VHYEVDVNGELKRITVTRDGDRFVVILGEHTWTVDAVQVGSHTLSLLLENGNTPRNPSGAAASSDLNRSGQVLSRELSVARDPLTGQFVVSVGTIPVSVGVNSRRRFGRRDDRGREGTGPQRIVAPMPGKVVRILGNPGDVVSQRPETALGLASDDCCYAVIRDAHYKYVHFARLPPLLFDIREDPHEMNNIAASPAAKDIVLRYAQKMLTWRLVQADRTFTNMYLSKDGLFERN